MLFTVFVKKLSSVLRAGSSTDVFTRDIFEEIVSVEGQFILDSYKPSSYKSFYNGTNAIAGISKKITIYIDAAAFSSYIHDFPDATVETLCNVFQEDIPEITPYNAGDKLAELFVSIITEAAGTTRKTNTTATSSTTEITETNVTPIYTSSIATMRKTFREVMNLYMDPLYAFNEAEDVYEEYLRKATIFYSEVKTLLYTEKPRRFYEFYVCNDLKFQSRDERVTANIPNVTVELLRMAANRIIITGIGGIGKSMMMRHLFFDCVEHYEETGVIPILMLLRDYKDTYTDFADVLYKTVAKFTDDVTWELFQEKLARGQCVILLDGLDEAIGTSRTVFETAINEFLMKYPDNLIVVTSRPTSTFVQMGFFQLFSIEPFTKEQAITLIDKLEYHDADVKQAFQQDLDAKLYDSHKEFAGNPLLLTIMLMTYDSYGDVPAKRHIFYRKAYEVMARLHDTTKGTYVRPMHTKLEPDEFAEYFAKFCAVTYREGILEFTEREFCYYMNEILKNSTKSIQAGCKDFLSDLTDNLCLLYKEGERYYFIHRSFQEYFCAVFISGQMDDHLQYFGEFFETQVNRASGDLTFDMLYNMIPSKIDRYVLLPHLQQLWKHYDSAQGYQSFLIDMYDRIYITKTADSTSVHYGPASFLYDFVLRQQQFGKQQQMEQLTWPPSIALCKRVEWNRNALFSELPTLCPETFGCDYWVSLRDLYDNPDKFAELIAFIESDKFPLKQEYEQLGTYIKQLDKTFSSKPNHGSWKDWLK